MTTLDEPMPVLAVSDPYRGLARTAHWKPLRSLGTQALGGLLFLAVLGPRLTETPRALVATGCLYLALVVGSYLSVETSSQAATWARVGWRLATPLFVLATVARMLVLLYPNS